MTKIKFGTDGWRAIIAKEYTTDNVARVSVATTKWLHNHHDKPAAVIGHDCRFGGEMFAEITAKIFCESGIKVYIAKGFVSTPMVSYGTLKLNAQAGIVITASHNPPSYNGYKLKAEFGGPAVPVSIDEVGSGHSRKCYNSKQKFSSIRKRRFTRVGELRRYVYRPSERVF